MLLWSYCLEERSERTEFYRITENPVSGRGVIESNHIRDFLNEELRSWLGTSGELIASRGLFPNTSSSSLSFSTTVSSVTLNMYQKR